MEVIVAAIALIIIIIVANVLIRLSEKKQDERFYKKCGHIEDHFNKRVEEYINRCEELEKNNEQLQTQLSLQKSQEKDKIKKARADSLNRQRATLKGFVSEQLAPYINSNYMASNYKFLGNPIDFIVFEGMDNPDSEITIIFMEVKTGKAQLKAVQRKIKDAIESGRVEFELYRPDKDFDNK